MKKTRSFLYSSKRISICCVGLVYGLSLYLNIGCTHISNQETPEPYNFSYDWMTSAIPIWTELLAPFAGKPNIHYLEVGVFEGRSAIWMLENILTHPTSTLTGIDLFPGNLKDRYLSNLQLSGFDSKATTITGRSQLELSKLERESYDIIYVDGGHTADMVLADAVLAWELLRIGGILIFDDYNWKTKEYPAEIRPGVSIGAFITAYRNYLELIHMDYQAIVRKKEGPHLADPYRTILGKYVYVWQEEELRSREDQKKIDLSESEKDLLETLIRYRPFGQTTFVATPRQILDTELRTLIQRLNLKLEIRWSSDGDS